MKPAAMLVRAFEVEIGRKLERGILAQYRLVRCARVEPHVEGVGELAILLRVDAEVLVRRLEPGFDAAALYLGRGEFEQGRRVGMQRFGFTIDEGRQRRAPLAPAR